MDSIAKKNFGLGVALPLIFLFSPCLVTLIFQFSTVTVDFFILGFLFTLLIGLIPAVIYSYLINKVVFLNQSKIVHVLASVAFGAALGPLPFITFIFIEFCNPLSFDPLSFEICGHSVLKFFDFSRIGSFVGLLSGLFFTYFYQKDKLLS